MREIHLLVPLKMASGLGLGNLPHQIHTSSGGSRQKAKKGSEEREN
jgi:hypothetical protein